MSNLTPLARRVAASEQLAATTAPVDDAWQVNLANINFEIETVIEGIVNDAEVITTELVKQMRLIAGMLAMEDDDADSC